MGDLGGESVSRSVFSEPLLSEGDWTGSHGWKHSDPR